MSLLQSKLLSQIPHLVHGFTTRNSDLPDNGNVSLSQGDPESARENRKRFTEKIGISAQDLTFSYQEHGTVIRTVSSADKGAGALDFETSLPAADGLITSEADLPLAIMVADCSCLLVSNREGQVIGSFHAGWRGVFANMPFHAAKAFENGWGISPKELVVWISPLICGECFEVGPDIWESFKREWGDRFTLEDPLRIDLPKLIRHQWVDSGVDPENIESPGLCTFEQTTLFSHRRGETPNGRMMGVLSRKK